MKQRYRFCGFILASDRSLPELENEFDGIPASGDKLIQLELGYQNAAFRRPSDWFLHQNLPNGSPWSSRARTQGGYLLRFHEIADFIVDHDGGRIRCVWRHAETSELTLRALLIDHVLPPVLTLHGSYVLHAAAVLTRSGVCAFAGFSGAGKSTLAAQLVGAGNDFLSDDCLVIDEQAGSFVAWASHPSVKLRDDSMEFLGRNQAGEPAADYTTKRRIRAADLGANFPPAALPLARLYFLNREREPAPTGKPAVERLSGRAAFLKLIHHSVRLDGTDRAMLGREF